MPSGSNSFRPVRKAPRACTTASSRVLFFRVSPGSESRPIRPQTGQDWTNFRRNPTAQALDLAGQRCNIRGAASTRRQEAHRDFLRPSRAAAGAESRPSPRDFPAKSVSVCVRPGVPYPRSSGRCFPSPPTRPRSGNVPVCDRPRIRSRHRVLVESAVPHLQPLPKLPTALSSRIAGSPSRASDIINFRVSSLSVGLGVRGICRPVAMVVAKSNPAGPFARATNVSVEQKQRRGSGKGRPRQDRQKHRYPSALVCWLFKWKVGDGVFQPLHRFVDVVAEGVSEMFRMTRSSI